MIEHKLSEQEMDRILGVMPDFVLAWKVVLGGERDWYTIPRFERLHAEVSTSHRGPGYHCFIRGSSAISLLHYWHKQESVVKDHLSHDCQSPIDPDLVRIIRVGMQKQDISIIGREPVFDQDREQGDLVVVSPRIYAPTWPEQDILEGYKTIFIPEELRFATGPVEAEGAICQEMKTITLGMRSSPKGLSIENQPVLAEIETLV